MNPEPSHFDCLVIGGGPAGATCAALLAGYGRRTLVLEKAQFPRHHIGESLMPHTYGTFKRLGMLDVLKASAFPRKESVQFISASGKESQPFYFTDRDPNEWSITWQVRRDEFDRLMLDNARRHGAEVREGVLAREVLFDGNRAIGVRAVIEGQTRDIHANVVVDATGISALLSRQLNMRYGDERLKNAAIYSYFKGGRRDPGRDAGATLIIHTPDNAGWFWWIPLPEDIISVGVVGPPSYLTTGRGNDPLSTLTEEIERCPGIRGRLEGAERVDRVYVIRDFSYCSQRIAGEGWVLIGDAFGFLDPIYSTGLMLALTSGEWAADAIHDALQANDMSAERLGRFGPRFVAGMQLLRQLVYAFYDPRFSFAEFVKRYPEYKDHLVRLLVGDVFNDEVGDIFSVMATMTDLPGPMKLEEGAVKS